MSYALDRIERAPSTSSEVLTARAVADLYDTTLPHIYGYLLRRCAWQVDVAEDLTQETYLAALRELRAGRHVEQPLPWLYGIARHKLIDHFRSEDRRTRGLFRWRESEPDSRTPEESWFGDERIEDEAGRLLAELPPLQQAVVALRHFDELSIAEIATAIGKSEHAVESLLARGRANLKRRRSRQEEDDGST
jgi:RNA polymerase sigma-70 factor (ECF subfamily)